jgi:hypothetical protein
MTDAATFTEPPVLDAAAGGVTFERPPQRAHRSIDASRAR